MSKNIINYEHKYNKYKNKYLKNSIVNKGGEPSSTDNLILDIKEKTSKVAESISIDPLEILLVMSASAVILTVSVAFIILATYCIGIVGTIIGIVMFIVYLILKILPKGRKYKGGGVEFTIHENLSKIWDEIKKLLNIIEDGNIRNTLYEITKSIISKHTCNYHNVQESEIIEDFFEEIDKHFNYLLNELDKHLINNNDESNNFDESFKKLFKLKSDENKLSISIVILHIVNKKFDVIIDNTNKLKIYLHLLKYVINKYYAVEIDYYFKNENISSIFRIIDNNDKLAILFSEFIIDSSEYSYNIEPIKIIFKQLLTTKDLINTSNESIIIQTYFTSGVNYINLHYIIDPEFIKLLSDNYSNYLVILDVHNEINKLMNKMQYHDYTEDESLKHQIGEEETINLQIKDEDLKRQIEDDEKIKRQIGTSNFSSIQEKFIKYLMKYRPYIYALDDMLDIKEI